MEVRHPPALILDGDAGRLQVGAHHLGCALVQRERLRARHVAAQEGRQRLGGVPLEGKEVLAAALTGSRLEPYSGPLWIEVEVGDPQAPYLVRPQASLDSEPVRHRAYGARKPEPLGPRLCGPEELSRLLGLQRPPLPPTVHPLIDWGEDSQRVLSHPPRAHHPPTELPHGAEVGVAGSGGEPLLATLPQVPLDRLGPKIAGEASVRSHEDRPGAIDGYRDVRRRALAPPQGLLELR